MRLSPATVREEYEWVTDRDDVVVPLINVVRERLGAKFGTSVDPVTTDAYHDAVDVVFSDGDRGVNAAALVRILRNLDVVDDYPGFVVDELLGRELAAVVAGEQPRRLLAEATFHYADLVRSEQATEQVAGERQDVAGLDDLDAALAAGFQTRLPGWSWTETESPFRIE